MNIDTYLEQWLAEAPVLAGSVVAVLFMVGIAALLGFRRSAHIDEAELQRLAEAEGAALEHSVVAKDAKSALARLQGGKLMIVRVMGADVSARVLPASAARVRLESGKVSLVFADSGFPPLHLGLEGAPPWLAELAAGEVP
jgi:hypothetical protein